MLVSRSQRFDQMGADYMKRLAMALMCLAGTAQAQSADSSFLQLVADKAKESRPVVRLNPWSGPSYGGYLPVWVFHSKYDLDDKGAPKKDPFKQFVTVGGGGKYDTATKAGNGFLAVELNVVALSARAWDWTWANDHVERSKFPPIWAGFSPDVPLSYTDAQNWTWKQNGRFQFSISYPL